MLWKILLLAACAVAVWGMTRPKKQNKPNNPQAQNLALCKKCGVYHHPDAPCSHPPRADSADKPS